MRRLLSMISVFCILCLIILISVLHNPDTPSPTDQNVHKATAGADCADLPSADKRDIQKLISDMVKLPETPEISYPTKRYMDKINSITDYDYLYCENEYGYQYSTYIYEDDYDGDGSKEAFVAIGQKTGDTKIICSETSTL